MKISKVVDRINKATSGLKFSAFTLLMQIFVSLKWGEDLVDSLARVLPVITILL